MSLSAYERWYYFFGSGVFQHFLFCLSKGRVFHTFFLASPRKKVWRVRNGHDGTSRRKRRLLSSVSASSFPNRKRFAGLRFGARGIPISPGPSSESKLTKRSLAQQDFLFWRFVPPLAMQTAGWVCIAETASVFLDLSRASRYMDGTGRYRRG